MPKTSKTVEHVENRRIRQTRETGIIEESQLLMSQMEANLKILGHPIFDRWTRLCNFGSFFAFFGPPKVKKGGKFFFPNALKW